MTHLKKNALPVFIVVVAVSLVIYMNYKPEGFYDTLANQKKQCEDKHKTDKRYSWVDNKKTVKKCVGPVPNASGKGAFPGCPTGYKYHNFNMDCKKDGSPTLERPKVKWVNNNYVF